MKPARFLSFLLAFVLAGGPAHAASTRVKATSTVLVLGSALTAVSFATENAERTAQRFDQRGWERVANVGNFYGDGITLGLGSLSLLAIGNQLGDANIRLAGEQSVKSLGITYAAVLALKYATQRTRPDGGRYSFPSGHTAGAFAVAPVLAQHFGRRVGIPAYGLALATSIGRLEDRRHYLSDVVFGATIGSAVGMMTVLGTAQGHAMSVGVGHGQVGVALSF